MANSILTGALDQLRARQIQGDPSKAYADTRRAIGMEELDRNRAQGMQGNPEAFKQRELGILAGYDPEKAMDLSGLYAAKKGVTSTKWDRQKEAMESPEAKAIQSEFASVLDRITRERAKNPGYDAGTDIAKLSELEIAYKTKTGVNLRTMLSRQTLRNLDQTKSFNEKNDDDANVAHQTIIKSTTDELDKSMAFGRTAVDSLANSIDQIKDDWDEGSQTFKPNYSASDVQVAVKSFVKSIDGSVVMKGEVKDIVGSSLWNEIKGFFGKLKSGVQYSKEDTEKLFATMVKAGMNRDRLMEKMVKGSIDEGKARVKAKYQDGQFTASQRDNANELLDTMGASRIGKYKVIPTDGPMPQITASDIFSGETPVNTTTTTDDEEEEW